MFKSDNNRELASEAVPDTLLDTQASIHHPVPQL